MLPFNQCFFSCLSTLHSSSVDWLLSDYIKTSLCDQSFYPLSWTLFSPHLISSLWFILSLRASGDSVSLLLSTVIFSVVSPGPRWEWHNKKLTVQDTCSPHYHCLYVVLQFLFLYDLSITLWKTCLPALGFSNSQHKWSYQNWFFNRGHIELVLRRDDMYCLYSQINKRQPVVQAHFGWPPEVNKWIENTISISLRRMMTNRIWGSQTGQWQPPVVAPYISWYSPSSHQ